MGGLDGAGESVGDELRDDLMVGVWEAGVGGPCDERRAVVGEVAYQRLVHSAVCRIVQGVPVYGQEPLDVVGEMIGQLMEARDRERLRTEIQHGVRLAKSLGLDVGEGALPF